MLINKRQDFLRYRHNWHSPFIGLVPTMGNLHAGHISLARQSLKENSLTIVTIFVNPKQFGPSEDFGRYPRTLEKDLDLLREVHAQHADKTLVVYAPNSHEEIYPADFSSELKVNGEITDILCGAFRPGHFSGVTTVVGLLFQLTRPRIAYFGKKDFQQWRVIEKMAKDFSFPLEVVGLPTIRESDGLAMSSRNQFLTTEQRIVALELSRTLRHYSDSSRPPEKVGVLSPPDIEGVKWDYLEIRRASDLRIPESQDTQLVILGAFRLGQTRLIDNMEFERR